MSSETFEIVYIWLYSGKLTHAEDSKDTSLTLNELMDIYMFGDEYEMPRLRNDAVDMLIPLSEKYGMMLSPSKSIDI